MNSSNGRINLIPSSPNTSKLFAIYDKIPVAQCVSFRDSTVGLWSETTLSNSFFSDKNIQIIQNGIRAGVFTKSNGKYLIGPQDCNSLKIIMRSIFLQNSMNLNQNIASQIEILNNKIFAYCIDQIYGEAQGYMNYLRDVSTLPEPLAPPSMVDFIEGRRTNKMNPWF